MKFFEELRDVAKLVESERAKLKKLEESTPNETSALIEIVKWRDNIVTYKKEIFTSLCDMEKAQNVTASAIEDCKKLMGGYKDKISFIEQKYSIYGYKPPTDQELAEEDKSVEKKEEIKEININKKVEERDEEEVDANKEAVIQVKPNKAVSEKENMPMTPKYLKPRYSSKLPELTGNYSQSKYMATLKVKTPIFPSDFECTPMIQRPMIQRPTNIPVFSSSRQPAWRESLSTPASFKVPDKSKLGASIKTLKNRYNRKSPQLADYGLEEYQEETMNLSRLQSRKFPDTNYFGLSKYESNYYGNNEDTITNLRMKNNVRKSPDMTDFGLSRYKIDADVTDDLTNIRLKYRNNGRKSPDLADFGLEKYKTFK